MSDKYGLDRQDSDGTFLDGPLEGQTSVTILIGKEQTTWLKHAVAEIGYSFADLVQISAEEAALNHAKTHHLL